MKRQMKINKTKHSDKIMQESDKKIINPVSRMSFEIVTEYVDK